MNMTQYVKFFLLSMTFSLFLISCEKKEVSISKQEYDSADFADETLPIGKVNDVTITIQQDAADTSENQRLQILIKRNKVEPDVSEKVKKQLEIDSESVN